MTGTIPKITLDNLTGIGGMEELFQKKMGDIVDNILDVNTEPTKARVMDIKIKFIPSADRTRVDTKVEFTTKLAGINTGSIQNYITSDKNGERVIGTVSPLEIGMFNDENEATITYDRES